MKICDEEKIRDILDVPVGMPFKLESEEGLKMKVCGACMNNVVYMLDLETNDFHLLPSYGRVKVYPDACIKLGES